MTSETREQILKGAKLIEEKAQELAEKVGVTLEKIEWDEGIIRLRRDAAKRIESVGSKSSYTLSLTAKDETIEAENIPSNLIIDYSDPVASEGTAGVEALLRACISELKKRIT